MKFKQHPVVRVADLVLGEYRGIAAVDRPHHLLRDVGERPLAAEVVPHHARRRRSVAVDDMVRASPWPEPVDLALVVVEGQVAALDVGQVRRDRVGIDAHLAVLHVLGVHEIDLVDQVQLLQQHGADEAVEVGAGDELVFLAVGHRGPPRSRAGVRPAHSLGRVRIWVRPSAAGNRNLGPLE